MDLSKNELKEIKGGGITFTGGLAIGAFFTFIIGLIDGYIRPLACR